MFTLARTACILLLATLTQDAWTPFNDPLNRHHPEIPSDIDVKKYLLRIDIDTAQPRTEGRMEVTLAPTKPIRRFELDAADMTVTSVRQGTQTLTFSQAKDLLEISLEQEIPREQEITLEIAYQGRPTRGLFWVGPDDGYPDKPVQVWSQGEAFQSHHWFPCHDDPSDRALMEIYVTVPAKFDVISNGARLDVKDAPQGRRTHHWGSKIDFPPYVASVVVAELDVYEDKAGDLPLQYIAPKGKFPKEDVLRVFDQTPDMIKFFSDLLEFPYPYEKYAQIVVLDYVHSGAQENVTASTFHEKFLVPARAVIDDDNVGVVSHELAHQWFGDLISCRTWTHMWLKEGIADYCEALWRGHHFGPDAFSEVMTGAAEGYFGEDASYHRPVVCDVYTSSADLWDTHTYSKGAWVMHMLRQLLGEEAWRKGMRLYVKRHARTAAETKDLRLAMEEASGQDLGWFFEQWLYRTGYPEITVKSTWDAARKVVILDVEQTQKPTLFAFGSLRTGTPEAFKAPVVIEIWTQKGRQSHTVMLDRRKQTFSFPSEAEPAMVKFDRDGALLMKLTFERPRTELLFQLQNDPQGAGRIWAAGQLAELKDDATIPAILRDAVLREKDPRIQRTIADTLGGLKGDAVRDALLVCANASDAPVRRAVFLGLRKWTGDASVRKVLRDAVEKDPNDVCRSAAAGGVAKTGEGAFELLQKLYDERRGNLFAAPALLDAMVATGDERAWVEVKKASAYGVPLRLRQSAVADLGRLAKGGKNEEAFSLLLKLLEDRAVHVRRASVRALSGLGDARAVDPLRRCAEASNDPILGKEVLKAIRKLESK